MAFSISVCSVVASFVRGQLRCSRSRWAAFALATAAVAATGRASADVYSYVDWTEADVAAGTAQGFILLPDDSEVTVSFAAINPDGSPGNLYGAQIDDGATNYWEPSAPYISSEVENAPPSTDILQLSGGDDQVYEVTLSEPIKDPVMAIVSLGSSSIQITYDFDSAFEIVSQGAGYWGGSDMALEKRDGDVLFGAEGHGTIRFIGTFSTFSWTVPSPESWHGFTFAIRTTERLEPTLADASTADDAQMEESDAGVADAGGVDEGATDPAEPDQGDTTPDDAPTGTGDPGAPDASTDATGDAGTGDGGSGNDQDTDAEADASGGCSCRLLGGDAQGDYSGLALLTLGALALRRRRVA